MIRIRSRSILLLLVLAAAAATVVHSGETPKVKKVERTGQETAVFQVPKLMEGTLLRDLVKALDSNPGIVLAQVDKASGSFHVTFEPKKTNPEEILKALSAVAKDVRLEKVVPADPKAAGSDCGKCPSAKSCPGAKASQKK